MEKQVIIKRSKRLKRKLKSTLVGSLKHCVNNLHVDADMIVKTDIKRMLRHFIKEENMRPKYDYFGQIQDGNWNSFNQVQSSYRPNDWVLGKV